MEKAYMDQSSKTIKYMHYHLSNPLFHAHRFRETVKEKLPIFSFVMKAIDLAGVNAA
jgi:hypothetical protein